MDPWSYGLQVQVKCTLVPGLDWWRPVLHLGWRFGGGENLILPAGLLSQTEYSYLKDFEKSFFSFGMMPVQRFPQVFLLDGRPACHGSRAATAYLSWSLWGHRQRQMQNRCGSFAALGPHCTKCARRGPGSPPQTWICRQSTAMTRSAQDETATLRAGQPAWS